MDGRIFNAIESGDQRKRVKSGRVSHTFLSLGKEPFAQNSEMTGGPWMARILSASESPDKRERVKSGRVSHTVSGHRKDSLAAELRNDRRAMDGPHPRFPYGFYET